MNTRSAPTAASGASHAHPPLAGGALVLGTLALSLGTFMNVLDTSIANVSLPHIAGDLGVSPSQGTWVITSFGVANAIAVPLTGWLTQRFGQVRLFLASVLLFVLTSFLCGLAPTFELLIAFRAMQGFVAGPMIPLSQTLLLASYPRARSGTALAFAGMTTLVAPVVGPLAGGWITDHIGWPWIFFINVPVGLAAAFFTWLLYRRRETPTRKVPVDTVGLALLVLWVGAMQVMLDKGKELDWFASGLIVTLAVVSVVGFAFFLVWELTDGHPVVELRLFARRNFLFATLCISVAYGVFFGTLVLLPLWLQQWMGYTATQAGWALAPVGVLALLLTPLVGRMINRVDPRPIVTLSFAIFALVMWMRAQFSTDTDLATVMVPTVIQGAAVACFFVPLMALSISGLTPERIPA
ncbi:MAG: DHA2 family efflux MFS transporter permease subunit, partial [Rubrivivax sp.]|nr:DHA2 family efflux MFS transporter permease subunit [Rubrivivax sp.]